MVLLHICCAPDGTVPWPALLDEGYGVTGFFYGNNIYPAEEWARRRDAVLTLAESVGMPVVVADYVPDEWLERTAELKDCPEGGERCAVCFGLQLGAAAAYAATNGFGAICTTLTISPHKDPVLLNEIGKKISRTHRVEWLERVWRKGDGFKKSVRISREMGLYRQNYCGCAYSLRERA
ncbi:epoxyqueuosine reductase QueH [Synergistaceae bacterium OttesenSCG-928-I11]|nr:epoxyqueuosine reductase QueH [Synergistaceae bacterium OttesenSCG-928-I11]